MSDHELDDAELSTILQRDVLPIYFRAVELSGSPTLVVLGGQPGAGRSRATRLAFADHGDDLVVLSGDELRAFHPGFVELARSGSPQAAQELARATAAWLRGCIRFARENHRSLLLDGSFTDASIVAATAGLFAGEGFRTRVIAVGSSRAESLLSVLSRDLRNVQARIPARITSREVHDHGFVTARALIVGLEDAVSVDRLTVVARDGRVAFDADRADGAEAFRGASAALVAAQSERMSRFDATQWLSELHQVTDFAASRRDLPPEVTELLVDLYETSLREVIPALQVPADGKFATAMEQRTVARLVSLRGALQPVPAMDVAAPVVAPAGPERGGVSR